MSTDPTRASWPLSMPEVPATTVASAKAGVKPGDREKILELAREFESFFVCQMIRQMRESMLGDQDQKDGLGAGTMTETMDVELARQLTLSGGIGLTRVLQGALDRQVGGSAKSSSETAATDSAWPAAVTTAPLGLPGRSILPVVTPAADDEPEAALPLPLSSGISSPFGIRADPFSGTRRFHAGVDIQAAYGREVPAAGSGRVVFSGAQGGYGNTVVIEHADGIRTRYAHLASVQVGTGAVVDAGAVIGRVGSTGRSTGPHLHFEVLQDGHPVNPEVAATKYAGLLKLGGVVADLPNSQPSTLGVAVGVDDEDSGQ
ncbi:MAG TPA: peptidoglycan DD-metalloendopeptidase family protein [Vicinamibacterales bacterium]|jgi:murein DD-endopeptidase MepM/ murein hydrolase activator NlpD